MTTYDRRLLVQAVIYHGRTSIEGCYCGWADLGKSHAEHVADVYEASVALLEECPDGKHFFAASQMVCACGAMRLHPGSKPWSQK